MYAQDNHLQSRTDRHDPAQDYIYRISHDLGAPIRAIVQFSQLMEMEETKALSDNGLLYMRFIKENGQMLQEMMAALLDLSRIKTPPAPYEPLNVAALFNTACETTRERYIQTKAHIETTDLSSCLCPPQYLNNIFLALIDNSFKFAAPERQLNIHLIQKNTSDSTEFVYSDNGIGIDAKFFDKLFIPFQRLHTRTEYPGLGIGLALAQRYAESLGGSLSLQASKVGACFSLKLPHTLQEVL